MALPTLNKTWQVSRNVSIPALGSTLAHARRAFKTIKDQMIGFALGAWTVRGSSNSTAAGMDSVDRWAADTNLVWSTGAHSWIVLRQTGIATNFELCIDLNNGFERSGSIVISPSAGFTGGTTSARPTATDEIVLINSNEIHGEFDVQTYLNLWQSTDGQSFRLLTWQGNITRQLWIFEKPRNTRTGWTNPSFSLAFGTAGGTSVVTFTNLFRTVGNGLARGRIGSTTVELNCTGEASSTGLLAAFSPTSSSVNDIDGAWDFYPIGIFGNTVGGKGRHGMLNDIWWAPTGLGQGDTAPNSTTDRQFVKFGDLWLPWDPGGSTIPLMT